MYESDLPSDKYWLTELNQTSAVSPYEIKITIINPLEEEIKMKEWLATSYRRGEYILRENLSVARYEIFFKKKEDATLFLLVWGDKFT